MGFLIDFIELTAWKMTPAPLFGAFHLTYLIIGLALCFAAAYLLRRLSERGEKIMFLIIGICLIVSEIYKQLFWYYAIGYAEYPWIRLPFHLCSMPMYFLPFMAFLRAGKVKSAIYDFIGVYCFGGGLISVIADGGLLREYWAMTVHCMTWHLVLVFIGLYLGFHGKIIRKLSGFIGATAVYYILAAAAFCLNLALWNVSNGTCDMFFIGPAPMEVVVFRDIAKTAGRPAATALYLLLLTLISLVFWLLLSRKPKPDK